MNSLRPFVLLPVLALLLGASLGGKAPQPPAVPPSQLLQNLWPKLTPGEIRQAETARRLFKELLAMKDPAGSDAWQVMLRNSMAELVCLEHVPDQLQRAPIAFTPTMTPEQFTALQAAANKQYDKDVLALALALRILGALDLEKNADYFTGILLDPALSKARGGQAVREAARDALVSLEVRTPPPVLHLLEVPYGKDPLFIRFLPVIGSSM